jgi:hypothetical protein
VSPTIRATPLLVGNAMKLSVGGVLMLVSLFEVLSVLTGRRLGNQPPAQETESLSGTR